MTAEIYLTNLGTDGAVIGATDDGFAVRIETSVDDNDMRSVSVVRDGYSEMEKVHTPNIALSKARDIITRQRRVMAGLSPDERALADVQAGGGA